MSVMHMCSLRSTEGGSRSSSNSSNNRLVPYLGLCTAHAPHAAQRPHLVADLLPHVSRYKGQRAIAQQLQLCQFAASAQVGRLTTNTVRACKIHQPPHDPRMPCRPTATMAAAAPPQPPPALQTRGPHNGAAVAGPGLLRPPQKVRAGVLQSSHPSSCHAEAGCWARWQPPAGPVDCLAANFVLEVCLCCC